MVGSASPFKTLELLYYLKKNKWDGVIYFDTFPIIEDAVKETKSNMEMMEYMDQLIDKIGLEYIEKIVDRNDAIKASQLMMEFFKGGTNYGL
jgi:xylose isomerase